MEHSYRLPRSIRPVRYELELRPDLVTAGFEGAAAIDIEVDEPTRAVVLNAAGLDVSSVRLERDGAPAGGTLVVSCDAEEQQLRVETEAPLAAGSYRLGVEFSGVLNDQLRGFYRSTFRDPEGRERVIATTQFEATDARRAFPCWDEPDFKATFKITLVVEEGLAALSNGAVESVSPRDDGRVEVRFAETMPMSTYLVAFVVGPFELTDPVEVAGVPVRVATPPGKLGLTAFPMEVARHSLRFLSEYFGIPYPGGKIDHVAIPDFAFGAMENLGCVTYRESLLLADPSTAAQADLQRIATVVAHETSHMWFGDLVTMKWWNGIWLNEAFATFMENTTAHDFSPEWQMWAAFGAGKAAAMEVDGLRSTRPVEFPVGRPEEAEAMFDLLTYQKGGSVLKMLEQYLGGEVFRRGISHYLTTHSYGNTETADLWDALEEVSGEPVRTIMDSWINQGGYPVVSAEVTGGGDEVTLTQGRFLYDGTGTDDRWCIPVNIRARVGGREIRERVLLDDVSARVTFPGPVEAVLVNDGGWGFYRCAYSPDLWRRLLQPGGAGTLSALERLQLLVDSWASVSRGDGRLEDWAAAARALSGDPDPEVWGAIVGSLRILDLSAEEDDVPALRRFAASLARPLWDRLGWTPEPGEGDRVATARGRILLALAEFGADADVVSAARDRLASHLDGDAERLAPDLVGPVARVVTAAGTGEDWVRLLDAYRGCSDVHEQLRYLYALGRTPSTDLQRRLLDMTLETEIRSQDAPFLVASMIGSRHAGLLAWEWTEGNWERIAERIPPALYVRLLESAGSVVDPRIAEGVHRFFDSGRLQLAPVRIRQIAEGMDVAVALGRRLAGSMGTALAG